MSGRTNKGKNALTQSTLEVSADEKFTRCPGNHSLPHRGNGGRCTPLYCADASLPAVRIKADIASSDNDDVGEDRLAKVKSDEELRTKIQLERRQVWQKFLQIPVDLRGADAEKYADEQLVDMLPFAVGVLKKQLMFGTEDQQERAAKQVLEANGKSRKEAAASLAPTMIIQMQPGTKFEFPWAPKTVDGSAKVVEAKKATDEEK